MPMEESDVVCLLRCDILDSAPPWSPDPAIGLPVLVPRGSISSRI
jgi:hypothetical protein